MPNKIRVGEDEKVADEIVGTDEFLDVWGQCITEKFNELSKSLQELMKQIKSEKKNDSPNSMFFHSGKSEVQQKSSLEEIYNARLTIKQALSLFDEILRYTDDLTDMHILFESDSGPENEEMDSFTIPPKTADMQNDLRNYFLSISDSLAFFLNNQLPKDKKLNELLKETAKENADALNKFLQIWATPTTKQNPKIETISFYEEIEAELIDCLRRAVDSATQNVVVESCEEKAWALVQQKHGLLLESQSFVALNAHGIKVAQSLLELFGNIGNALDEFDRLLEKNIKSIMDEQQCMPYTMRTSDKPNRISNYITAIISVLDALYAHKNLLHDAHSKCEEMRMNTISSNAFLEEFSSGAAIAVHKSLFLLADEHMKGLADVFAKINGLMFNLCLQYIDNPELAKLIDERLQNIPNLAKFAGSWVTRLKDNLPKNLTKNAWDVLLMEALVEAVEKNPKVEVTSKISNNNNENNNNYRPKSPGLR